MKGAPKWKSVSFLWILEFLLIFFLVTRNMHFTSKMDVPENGIKATVLCISNANDNRRISRFVLAIYHPYVRETSHGLANVKTINQRDIGTILVISRRDIVLGRLSYNDISQNKTINCHNNYIVVAKFVVTMSCTYIVVKYMWNVCLCQLKKYFVDN